MLRFIVGVWAFLVPVAAGAQEKQPVIEEAVLRKAVTKALPVIQKSQQVFYQKIEFVGHAVSKMGIEVMPDKVERVLQWPTPINPTEV